MPERPGLTPDQDRELSTNQQILSERKNGRDQLYALAQTVIPFVYPPEATNMYLYALSESLVKDVPDQSPMVAFANANAAGIRSAEGSLVNYNNYITHHIAPHPKVFVIGTEGMKQAMRDGGLELVGEHPDVVVVGVDPSVTHDMLRDAAKFVRNGAKLVVAGPDRRAVTEDGFDLGSGSIGAVVAHAAGVEPVYAAKPFEPIVEEALERLRIPKEQVAIVGDTLETDIMTKHQVGLGMAILVLSGNSTREMAENIPQEKKPDMILESIKNIVEYL